MFKPGQQIGQYKIHSVLGDGGMAVVYRGIHAGMGTEHAVKVLLPNLALNPKTVERFRQEARAQFCLRHPHIVQVTDFVEQEDAVALVMDLVSGPTLRAAMEQRPGPWPVTDTLAVMRPVLDAVGFAHRSGLDGQAVVHRDLKPENILLDLSGQRAWPGIPKVSDFGIAKVMGSANVGTRTNARMGTVPYMAPEQFRSAKDVDARADVWALGMMLWQLLAGRLPLDPDDNVELLQLYQGLVAVPPLHSVVAGAPAALSAAVAQALSVAAAGRFADGLALLRALDGATAHRVSVVPGPPPSPERASAAETATVAPSPSGPAVAVAVALEPDKPSATDDRRPWRAGPRVADDVSTRSRAERFDRVTWGVLVILGVLSGPFVYMLGTEKPPKATPAAVPVASQDLIDAPTSPVLATDTGLMWQLATAPGSYDWQGAQAYCNGLSLGGFDDWRLPAREELEGLVDMSQRSCPYVMAPLIATTSCTCYWSATAYSGSSSYAWLVNFSNGFSYYLVITNSYRVRCVR